MIRKIVKKSSPSHWYLREEDRATVKKDHSNKDFESREEALRSISREPPVTPPKTGKFESPTQPSKRATRWCKEVQSKH